MDSQYQDGRDDPRQGASPFSEPDASRTAWLVFALCVAGLIGYKVYTMQGDAMPKSTPPQAPVSAPAPQAQQAQPERPTTPLTEEPARPQTVTKCVINGATVYTDSGCPANAKVSSLDIKPHENVAASQRPAPPPVAEQHAPPVAAVVVGLPAPVTLDQSAKSAECDALSKAINAIDARARQPLSAQEQDWLAARRKEHRDRQFRIQC